MGLGRARAPLGPPLSSTSAAVLSHGQLPPRVPESPASSDPARTHRGTGLPRGASAGTLEPTHPMAAPRPLTSSQRHPKPRRKSKAALSGLLGGPAPVRTTVPARRARQPPDPPGPRPTGAPAQGRPQRGPGPSKAVREAFVNACTSGKALNCQSPPPAPCSWRGPGRDPGVPLARSQDSLALS